MSYRWIGFSLAILGAAAFCPNHVRAQPDYPGNPSLQLPLPLGNDRPETGGFFAALEFITLHQTRALGNQNVGVRGLLDSTGAISGQVVVDPVTGVNTVVNGRPGTYIGSGTIALNTQQLGRTSYEPGSRITLGYKFESGSSLSFSYLHLFEAKYTASASLIPPFFRGPADLSETFLTAGVFNFPTEYAGPLFKTNFDLQVPGTTYGIWNGATQMQISLVQRFDTADITYRSPVYESEYARSYALAGGRFAWFFERFKWRTLSADINGATGPGDVAVYTNTLSQRLYGPYVGVGQDMDLGSGFGFEVDCTGALLAGIIKERAKYKLEDNSIQNKNSRDEIRFVPNSNIAVNLAWRPAQFIEIKAGYTGMFFFNTKYMSNPIDFNYGALDPSYNTQFLRVLHGANFGIALTF